MSRSFPLNALADPEKRLYAFREGDGELRLWSEGPESSACSLSWRKFFAPRGKSSATPIWSDFPDSASWAFGEGIPFACEELPATELLGPPSHSPITDKPSWFQLCEEAEAAIRTGRVRKVVPARSISIPVTAEERRRLLAALPGRFFGASLPTTFRFLVKSGESVFLGASPELLFRREGGALHVPAIAGTRPLPAGASEAAMREELQSSPKEQREHAVVVEGIVEALKGLGLSPSAPGTPGIIRAPGLLHLHSPVRAADLAGISSQELLAALHPTPAIAGYPKRESWDFLWEKEPWDRGLFSAPLLFRFPGRELCVVAIRSALLTRTHVHFFAGAGYVDGSDPESEWKETGKKMQVLQSLLFGENYEPK